MKKLSILCILAAVVLMTSPAIGGVSEAAVLYLRVAAGARPGGMGEAFVAIADDATATYWNPAGLARTRTPGIYGSITLPSGYGSIVDAVSLVRNDRLETWVISGDKLLRFDGSAWQMDNGYRTSSDQTFDDFLNGIIRIDDEEKRSRFAENVIVANCQVSPEAVKTFLETVRANTPADYKDLKELSRGLDTLNFAYRQCLLKHDQFEDLRNKLAEGMKDEKLEAQELDRITFSLESAVMRFLPSVLRVPYSAGLDGRLVTLAATGEYLWVGTNNGLYRLSGINWARFDADNGLPSEQITALSSANDFLLIGTASGAAKYYHGSFSGFGDLPGAPVSALAIKTTNNGYAVVGGTIYRFNGDNWVDSYEYTVRLDDTIENLARQISIYKTPDEIASLVAWIRERNAPRYMDTASVIDTTSQTADSLSPAATVPAGDGLWFTEGVVIRLPYGRLSRYEARVMLVDAHDELWIGTNSGLLSYGGFRWTQHGYNAFTVPAGPGQPMSAEDIAGKYLPGGNPESIGILAKNIREYNVLGDRLVEPGQTVYVYNHNLGGVVTSLGFEEDRLYVGTEHSFEVRDENGWETIDPENLNSRRRIRPHKYIDRGNFGDEGAVAELNQKANEVVVMHVNWLPTLNLDIYYDFFAIVHSFESMGTIGASIIYLNYGAIERRSAGGVDEGTIHPFEIAGAVSYGVAVTSRLKLGLSGRFIHSRLSPQGVEKEQGEGIATTAAVDLGMQYRISRRLQFGAAVTNLGFDIVYIDAEQADALPRNLGIGFAYRLWDSPYNKLIVQTELNKMLVGLDRGFGKELENAIRHVGAEYWYAGFLALRAGFKYDKEGDVKHATFGAGLRFLNTIRADFAYVPSSVDSPLANTIRLSMTIMF